MTTALPDETRGGPFNIVASTRIPRENLNVLNNLAWGLLKVYPRMKDPQVERILADPDMLGSE